MVTAGLTFKTFVLFFRVLLRKQHLDLWQIRIEFSQIFMAAMTGGNTSTLFSCVCWIEVISHCYKGRTQPSPAHICASGWRERWSVATGTKLRRSFWRGSTGSSMRSKFLACVGEVELVSLQAWSGASWTSPAMAGEWGDRLRHTHLV